MPLTKYIWDVESDNVMTETDENDVTTAVYNHEPDEFGSLISQRRGNVTSTYHYDGTGSTRELTDSTETVTDTYTAFGETVSSSGTTTNPFRYVGEKGYYFDEETEDYYVRERIYRPTTTRWTSPDPLGFVDGSNLYSYATNAPMYFVDPSGLTCEVCAWHRAIWLIRINLQHNNGKTNRVVIWGVLPLNGACDVLNRRVPLLS